MWHWEILVKRNWPGSINWLKWFIKYSLRDSSTPLNDAKSTYNIHQLRFKMIWMNGKLMIYLIEMLMWRGIIWNIMWNVYLHHSKIIQYKNIISCTAALKYSRWIIFIFVVRPLYWAQQMTLIYEMMEYISLYNLVYEHNEIKIIYKENSCINWQLSINCDEFISNIMLAFTFHYWIWRML